MTDTLKPAPSILSKLGSITVHADEMMSADGRDVDRVALERLLVDPEIVGWLAEMSALALVPRKRRST